VLPGMQSAFVEIGLPRAAFHVMPPTSLDFAEGTFRAEELVLRGKCRGELWGKQRLELGPGCRHQGGVEAPRVQIHPLARLEGSLRMPDVVPVPPPPPASPGRRRLALAAHCSLEERCHLTSGHIVVRAVSVASVGYSPK